MRNDNGATLSIFREVFEKKEFALSTDEWPIFVDIALHFFLKQKNFENTDIASCADAYITFSQEYLHLYSKKLTITFLLSAATAFVESKATAPSDLFPFLQNIWHFLLDLIDLSISEDVLCQCAQLLISHYALCNEHLLQSFSNHAELLSPNSATEPHQDLLSRLHARLLKYQRCLLFEAEIAARDHLENTAEDSLNETIRPLISKHKELLVREAHGFFRVSNEGLPQASSSTVTEAEKAPDVISTTVDMTIVAKNIELAMGISINATSDRQKKTTLTDFKTDLVNTETFTQPTIKKFLKDFALSAAKPKSSCFGEAQFGNTSSMKKFFLNLSQENQQLLRETLPEYVITHKPGLLGRNGELIFTLIPSGESAPAKRQDCVL